MWMPTPFLAEEEEEEKEEIGLRHAAAFPRTAALVFPPLPPSFLPFQLSLPI